MSKTIKIPVGTKFVHYKTTDPNQKMRRLCFTYKEHYEVPAFILGDAYQIIQYELKREIITEDRGCLPHLSKEQFTEMLAEEKRISYLTYYSNISYAYTCHIIHINDLKFIKHTDDIYDTSQDLVNSQVFDKPDCSANDRMNFIVCMTLLITFLHVFFIFGNRGK